MPCSCGTNGDRARSALQLKRSYISSGANTSLTKALNGMHKAIATKAYLHLNDCSLYICLAYEGATA